MKHLIPELLFVAGVLLSLYAAGIGDGGGSWGAIVGCAVVGVALVVASFVLESRR